MAVNGHSALKIVVPALCLLSGCASLTATTTGSTRSASGGSFANGVFDPGQAPSEVTGPNLAFECHAAGLLQLMGDEAKDQRPAGSSPAVIDGQLCAAAESLLAWSSPDPVPQSVLDFVSSHVGLPSPPLVRVLMTTLASEEVSEQAPVLNEVVGPFVKKAANPHFGVATLRLAKGSTRVVLLMLDAVADVAAVPRKLALSTSATVKGTLLQPNENAELRVSDAQGKLQTLAVTGKDIQATLECGAHAGRIQVELRNAQRAVWGLTVQCGLPLPLTLKLPTVWPADAVAQGKKVLELINAERVESGLNPLVWDDGVAGVARTVAEGLRSSPQPQDPLPLLQKADLMSSLVLENPGQALTTEEAQRAFSTSPVLRVNYMNPEITQAGIGVAPEANGLSVFVAEIFTRQLPPPDVAALQAALSKAIADKRTAGKLPPLAKDAALEAAAGQYAAALAASKNTLTNAQSNAFLTPLYKTFATVDVLAGARLDPVSIAEEARITGKGQVLGVGLAQGSHPTLGKNSVYVVVLIGVRR